MKRPALAAALLGSTVMLPAFAQAPEASPAAPATAPLPAAAPATAPAAAPAYSTDTTDIGTLLDDPASRAIVDKYIPGLSSSRRIGMARGMTFKQVQAYAPHDFSDATLAKIDADLAKLPPRK